jgi:pimeloyl-ACP methyl ester carboxylesterase
VKLDRIPLDGAMEVILETTKNPMIDSDCIILIGGSKEAELSLALASYYTQIKAVIAVVPGSAIFAAHTLAQSTPSFTLSGEHLPFVSVPLSARPALLQRDLIATWIEMLKNQKTVDNASIAVEKINGPLLFLSAMKDEMWPSTEMSEVMMDRLQSKQFPHYFEHVAIDGNHASPLERFDSVENFLEERVMSSNQGICAR